MSLFFIYILYIYYNCDIILIVYTILKMSKLNEPMNEMIFQSIMGEYLIDPSEYYENQGIRRAYAMNDEVMLRKILECEY